MEREEEGFRIGEGKFWNLEKKVCLELSKLFPEKRVLTTASTESIDFLVNLRTDSFHLPTSPVSLGDPLALHLMSCLLFSFVLDFPAVCSFIFLHCGSPSDVVLVFLCPANVVVTHFFPSFWHHSVVTWLRMAGTFGDHLHTPAPAGSPRAGCPGPFPDSFYFQGLRLHNLSWTTCASFRHPQSKKRFPDVQREPPVFLFVPSASVKTFQLSASSTFLVIS